LSALALFEADEYSPSTTYTASGLNASSDYTFNIWAYDNYGHKTAAAPLTQGTAGANQPPTISFSTQPTQTPVLIMLLLPFKRRIPKEIRLILV